MNFSKFQIQCWNGTHFWRRRFQKSSNSVKRRVTTSRWWTWGGALETSPQTTTWALSCVWRSFSSVAICPLDLSSWYDSLSLSLSLSLSCQEKQLNRKLHFYMCSFTDFVISQVRILRSSKRNWSIRVWETCKMHYKSKCHCFIEKVSPFSYL